MSRRRKDPLRVVKAEERAVLEQIARAQSESASHVARAKILLAVADGKSYQEAAEGAGRKSNDAVSRLVTRFNQEGLSALVPRHGGGPAVVYGATERARIVQEARRAPDVAKEGATSWSLTRLRDTLRRAPDGLAQVSTYTIWVTLREAGLSWQADSSWCDTGKTKRRRKSGIVEVTDPEAAPKKS